MNKYEAVIGLEVHAQLLTESKAFCGCKNKFGSQPNTNVCPICLGHPGSLPSINKKMVEYSILAGLALNCQINSHSVFARKNYFYPDLPKGWQTSQYDKPICSNGYIEIESGDSLKKIRINRIHMEEDAGKLIHDADGSLIDLNRCGTPLIEIVTEPDLNSPREAHDYLSKLKQILLYLNISDCNMEEGSLRCDANISIRKIGDKSLGTKTELKNMNSFKNVEKALEKEIERQIELIEDGEKVVQETLLWDAETNKIFSMRSKEEAHDYRYLPEPDLLPIYVDEAWKSNLKSKLPELPDKRKERFIKQFNLPEYDAKILTNEKSIADYFELAANYTSDFKLLSNWIMVDVLKILNEKNISIADFRLSANNLAKLINLIASGKISSKMAKDIFAEIAETNSEPEIIISERGFIQINDTNEISNIISNVLSSNPQQVEQYLAGKEKVLGFFVGQIMRETKGKANPKLVNDLLIKKLIEYKN